MAIVTITNLSGSPTVGTAGATTGTYTISPAHVTITGATAAATSYRITNTSDFISTYGSPLSFPYTINYSSFYPGYVRIEETAEHKEKRVIKQMNENAKNNLVVYQPMSVHAMPPTVSYNRSNLNIFKDVCRTRFDLAFDRGEYIDIAGEVVDCAYYPEWLDIMISSIYFNSVNRKLAITDRVLNEAETDRVFNLINRFIRKYSAIAPEKKAAFCQFARKHGIAASFKTHEVSSYYFAILDF